MIIPSKNADIFRDNVDLIGPMDVGKLITISAPDHEEDDGATYESTGRLYTLQRKFDEEGNFSRMIIKLGGPDATVANGMMFVLDADEAASGEYKFRVNDGSRV